MLYGVVVEYGAEYGVEYIDAQLESGDETCWFGIDGVLSM